MNMHTRRGYLHSPQNVTIIEGRQTVGQTALNTNFGGAERPGFDCLLRHGLKTMEVAVGFSRTTTEGAKLASDKADIGEIDIAIDHVGDQIADQIAAQDVSRDQQGEQVVSFRM